MPWTGSTFAKHNHHLSPQQSGHAASVANAILRRTGNEGLAIATANAREHRATGGLVRRDTGPQDWTDRLQSSRRVHQFADPQMMALPEGGIDKRMEHVFDEDLDGSSYTRAGFGFGGSVPGFADGGETPDIGGVVPTSGSMNPNTQALIQRFSALPTEKLQETVMRLGNSPVAGIANRVLQQKRTMPTAQTMPQMQGGVTPATPPQSALQPALNAAPPAGFASGGSPMGLPMGMADPPWARSEARGMVGGFLHSPVPGRTDKIPLSPAADSFVIPADVVSGLGEGNSLAGAHALQAALATGPHGIPLPRGGGSGHGIPHAPHMGAPQARGGKTQTVPILAAGGEFLVTPEQVKAIGHGDFDRGHKILEKFVVHVRKKTVKTMARLPGPVKS